MIWEVEGTDEFVEWFEALDRTDQVRVEAAIEHLERFGPGLGSPGQTASAEPGSRS